MPDFLKVEEILRELNLKEDMMAAEFGCGSAAFALAIARKLSKGRVYAIDIQEEKLSALKGRLALEKINNVFTVMADLEADKGSTLQNNSLDLVLVPNVLFQAEDKGAIIKEAKRVLKDGGELLVIDWLKAGSLHSPKDIVGIDDVKRMAESMSFSFKKEFQTGDYHYALLFIK